MDGKPDMAFMEEAQQYDAVSEIFVVVRLLHKALLVFGGDNVKRGGLNKSAIGAARARQKLLTRRHGLRMESKQLLPTQLAAKIRALGPAHEVQLATGHDAASSAPWCRET